MNERSFAVNIDRAGKAYNFETRTIQNAFYGVVMTGNGMSVHCAWKKNVAIPNVDEAAVQASFVKERDDGKKMIFCLFYPKGLTLPESVVELSKNDDVKLFPVGAFSADDDFAAFFKAVLRPDRH
jgi:hypothetical protein